MPLTPELPVLVESGLAPDESLGRDRFLLEAVRADPGRWPAALRVYEVAGAVVSLGRWQAAPPGTADPGVALLRRLGGGRAAAFGDGFVGVTLVLPRRGALLDEPAALRPEQILNRYVRGILAALEGEGIPALYPGRDMLTVRRRLLAILAFAETAAGALLVEALLPTNGDPSALPPLLERADPGGVVPATMLLPDETTSLAAERGRAPALADVAAWLERGFSQRLGVRLVPRALAADEAARVRELGAASASGAWLPERGERPDLPRRASVRTMLGTLAVQLATGAAGRITAARFTGEFFAADGTVPALEAALRGCDAAAVGAAVKGVLADPRHFVLGVGPVATVTDVVRRALA